MAHNFYQILIGCLKLAVSKNSINDFTFYIEGVFIVYHYWECTYIYCSLSYPIRSLEQTYNREEQRIIKKILRL